MIRIIILFADGLCHIMWFSIERCIKTKNYSTKKDKISKVVVKF